MTMLRRWCGHKSSAKHNKGGFLHSAIRKYGVDNFIIQEVASCKKELLNDLEKHYIHFFGTHYSTGHGYNLTLGGDLPPNHTGLKRSDETREKMSKAQQGRPEMSDECKTRISQTKIAKGQKPSTEHMEKLRVLATGRKMSQEHIETLAALRRGKKKSSEEMSRRTETRRANAILRGKEY